jgi:hypothetical protein
MSLSCECCEVGLSASGRSLVQISPTAFGASGCDREASIMRKLWPVWDCCALKGVPGLIVETPAQRISGGMETTIEDTEIDDAVTASLYCIRPLSAAQSTHTCRLF